MTWRRVAFFHMKKSEKCLHEMDYALNWSERAIANLNSIENHIAEHSPTTAKKIISELLACAEDLVKFPLMGSAVSELSDTRLRQLIKYSYFYPNSPIPLKRSDIEIRCAALKIHSGFQAWFMVVLCSQNHCE